MNSYIVLASLFVACATVPLMSMDTKATFWLDKDKQTIAYVCSGMEKSVNPVDRPNWIQSLGFKDKEKDTLQKDRLLQAFAEAAKKDDNVPTNISFILQQKKFEGTITPMNTEQEGLI